MVKHNNTEIDKDWTLFLDRDGVINKKIEGGYVRNWKEFEFIYGAELAMSILSKIFNRIIIVTNQRGVGKGIMTLEDLNSIHEKMNFELGLLGGVISKIYYCTDVLDNSKFRKPNIGMALLANKEFPSINFNKSFMVGDSESDLRFGRNLSMKNILINNSNYSANCERDYDFRYNSLLDFAKSFKQFP